MTPILRRRRLEPSWDYTAEGIIWRLHPARGGMLLGEERNTDARTVSFFCVDRSGVRWKRKNFGEQWWTGIETVHGGVLFLYGFATPDLPGRRGITAVDCLTGELLWTNGNVTIIGALGGRIYTSQETALGPVVCELDHRTGAPVREIGRGEDAVQQVPRPVDDIEDVEYPQVLSEDDASPLSALVRKLSAPCAPGCPVEFGDTGGFVVVVYHRAGGTAQGDERTFTRVLDVVERDSGDVAMHVTLDGALSTPAYGSFLVQAETLYFVRERKTLFALPLRAQ